MAWAARRWPTGDEAWLPCCCRRRWPLNSLASPLNLPEAAPVNSAYRMLANMRPGPVVEFPFFYERSDFPRHAEYMLYSTYHWLPLVNGYSDHIPQEFRAQVIPLSSFPTMESFGLLEAGARPLRRLSPELLRPAQPAEADRAPRAVRAIT